MAEKIDINELKAEQAKIKFEETADKIISDPQIARENLQYLLTHPNEYKEIFGHDLKIKE